MRRLQDQGSKLSSTPWSLGHLSRRFLNDLAARPLSPSEAAAVRSWLDPALATLFFDQPPVDQRHGYHAALTVLDHGGSGVLVVAALMHDVGKRHARLGILGRTLASLLMKLGAPLPRRFGRYRDHGVEAAQELAGLGAPALVVDFALHHHDDRPGSIDPATWAILQMADQPAKTRSRIRTGITSPPT